MSSKKKVMPQFTTGGRPPVDPAVGGVICGIRRVHPGRVGKGSGAVVSRFALQSDAARARLSSADAPGDPGKESNP
jgi:hypothetical protein